MTRGPRVIARRSWRPAAAKRRVMDIDPPTQKTYPIHDVARSGGSRRLPTGGREAGPGVVVRRDGKPRDPPDHKGISTSWPHGGLKTPVDLASARRRVGGSPLVFSWRALPPAIRHETPRSAPPLRDATAPGNGGMVSSALLLAGSGVKARSRRGPRASRPRTGRCLCGRSSTIPSSRRWTNAFRSERFV